MRILFIGDVVGRTGRKALKAALPDLRDRFAPDLVVANGENAAGGIGLTPETAKELFAAGVEVITLGNHTWDQKTLAPFLDEHPRIVRPYNFPPGLPGRGWLSVPTPQGPVAVLNLMGRVFFTTFQEDPFRTADAVLEDIHRHTRVVLVDFHAEATSEKQALAWYLDGRVTAVIGTHTHVQTADARVLPGGTGYISDVGMTGARDSVIGVKTETVIQRFLTQQPLRLEAATGPAILNAVLIEAETNSGRCLRIEPIALQLPPAAD